MKFLIAAVLLAAISYVLAADAGPKLSEEQKSKVKQYVEECIKQEKVKEQDAQKVRNQDFSNPSANVKCFTNCFLEKVGFIKNSAPQDAAILEKLGALIGKDKTKNIIKKCNSLKGKNKCDTAFKLYECYQKATGITV